MKYTDPKEVEKKMELSKKLHAMPWMIVAVGLLLGILFNSPLFIWNTLGLFFVACFVVVGLRMGGFIAKPKRDGFFDL